MLSQGTPSFQESLFDVWRRKWVSFSMQYTDCTQHIHCFDHRWKCECLSWSTDNDFDYTLKHQKARIDGSFHLRMASNQLQLAVRGIVHMFPSNPAIHFFTLPSTQPYHAFKSNSTYRSHEAILSSYLLDLISKRGITVLALLIDSISREAIFKDRYKRFFSRLLEKKGCRFSASLR